MFLELEISDKVDKDWAIGMLETLDFVAGAAETTVKGEVCEAWGKLLAEVGAELYQLEDGSDPNCPLNALRGEIEDAIGTSCSKGHKDWSRVMRVGAVSASVPAPAPEPKEEGPDVGVWTDGSDPKGLIDLIGHVEIVDRVEEL